MPSSFTQYVKLKKYHSRCFFWFTRTILLILISSNLVNADTTSYDLKSAFVFNFCKLIKFPESSFNVGSQDLALCVFADPKYQESFNKLSNQRVNNRSVSVKQIDFTDSPSNCQVIFISAAYPKAKGFLSKIKSSAVLTIGEADWFINEGGVINFFYESGKLRFAINNESALAKGFKISSRLLRLAAIIDL